MKQNTVTAFKKNQFGTEKSVVPLSYIHDKPSELKIFFSRLSIVITLFFWLLYISSVILKQLIEGPQSHTFLMEVIGYSVVVSFLTFSALMYLIARQGAFTRFRKHKRTPRAIIDKHFASHKPSITVLVPSYNEEISVIKKTLLSAALQEYPNIKVVLLIDDNPNPEVKDQKEKLEITRNLGESINSLLSKPSAKFLDSLRRFEKVYESKTKKIAVADIKKLASDYRYAAEWLQVFAENEPTEDHVDMFFQDYVISDLAKDLLLVEKALLASVKEKATLTRSRVHQLHQRLVWIFGTQVSVFERKQYISLSNEPNKAMNLNAYISLMGNSYKIEKTEDGNLLIPTKTKKAADLIVPDSDFLLTLDADSILLKEYCLRLVYFLQQSDNTSVAVAQTPYSSFRGAPTRIERISGATTDIQHILHQGKSYYNAAFWVGANAVIRKPALDDIVQKEWIGGFEIKRYIQDNTVIEDTESSIDLALHGWRIVNYPERLSYSATPPDFGSLVVQRRRWANGGLLILPKFLSQLKKLKNQGHPASKIEVMLRINYMASIAWSNIGLLFILAYPYDGRLLSPLVLLAATPYFLAMASDLKYCRYKYTDILWIYGFNLILLPVNLAGVIKSIQQALTTQKIPFARTPKVKHRTSAGFTFVSAPLLIIGFSLFTLWRNIQGENWGNAAFAGFNAFAASWAVISYIGLRELCTDLVLGFLSWFVVEVPVKESVDPKKTTTQIDWKVILYHGDESGDLPHSSLVDIVTKAKK